MIKKDKLLKWSSKYSVTDKAIDEQQKKMFNVLNDLSELVTTNKADKNIAIMVNSLTDYSKLFFSMEEKFLKHRGYPDFEAHIKEHRKFLRLSIELRRKISDNLESIELEDVECLKTMFIDHIENSDCLYIPFLRIKAYIDGSKK